MGLSETYNSLIAMENFKTIPWLDDLYKTLKDVPYVVRENTVDSKTLLHEGGVCFDFVRYLAEVFTSKKIKYRTFFMACYSNRGDPCDKKTSTHTFVIVEYQSIWYWVEVAWGSQMGVHPFTDIDKALTQISSIFYKEKIDKVRGHLNPPTLFEYDALDPRYIDIPLYDFVVRIGGNSTTEGIGKNTPYQK